MKVGATSTPTKGQSFTLGEYLKANGTIWILSQILSCCHFLFFFISFSFPILQGGIVLLLNLGIGHNIGRISGIS
jgi:hypothetical protein